MNPFGKVDESDECGRFGPRLRGIEKFEPTAVMKRRFGPHNRILDNPVQRTGCNPRGILIVDGIDEFEYFGYPLPGLGGNGQYGCEVQIFGLEFQVVFDCRSGLVVFRDQVPLVEQKNASAPFFKSISGDLDILFGDAFAGIEDD